MARAKPDRAQPSAPSRQGPPAAKADLGEAIARVAAKRKTSSAHKIGKLIEDHPDEAVTVLRGWLHQSQ